MRTNLAVTILLVFALSSLVFAEPHHPTYTTIIVEYVGEEMRYVPPIVISTSREEGQWYRQHLLPRPGYFLVHVQVVPPSILNEITEFPLLKHSLEGAKPVNEEPKAARNVRFIAGVGHHYEEIMIEKQTSAKILTGIAGGLTSYPTLKSELKEIESQLG